MSTSISASCSDLAPEQQAAIRQVLTVACNVDGMVVPVAQPVREEARRTLVAA